MKMFKYPKTLYLSTVKDVGFAERSEGSYDKMTTDNCFLGKEVVVTLKLDGENTTIYSNGQVHARSLNSKRHVSRDWVTAFAMRIATEKPLPEGLRIVGENMWAKHTIEYDDLDTYFYGFSAWSGDQCLSWDLTQKFFNCYGITSVPEIYRGEYDRNKIEKTWEPYADNHEGYVVRSTKSFLLKDFSLNVGKFVKPNFIQTDEKHWFFKSIKKNKLKENQ